MNVHYDVTNLYIASKWLSIGETLYAMAKPDGNKVKGRGSTYPWTANQLQLMYKKYCDDNGKKPSRKKQSEWSMSLKVDPQNTDEDLDAFTAGHTFLTNLRKRYHLQEYYEKAVVKCNQRKYNLVISSDDDENDESVAH